MKLTYTFLIFALIFSSVFYSCNDSSTDPEETTSISGIVKDGKGNPVESAYVEAMNSNDVQISYDYSDENGLFLLGGISLNKSYIKISIFKQGFITYETIIDDFSDGKDKKIYPVLLNGENDSCCGKIKIIVKDRSDSSVVENAQVRLNTGENIIEKLYSDENGEVFFDSLCPDDYWVRIAKDGYLVIEKDLTVEDCDTLEYSFWLESRSEEDCCGKIEISVKKDADNSAISNAEVRLNNKKKIIEKLYTNENGKVFFDSLCPDDYWIRIAKEGFKVIEKEISVEDCDTLKYTYSMKSINEQDTCCDGILYLIPKDSETSEILNGAVIKLWQDGKLIEKAITGEGYAVIDNICEGNYWVDIIHEGYEAIEFEIEFDCNETKEITKELDPKECCEGVIYVIPKDSETNEIISGAKVRLWQSGDLIDKVFVGESGYARFLNVCEGEYAIDILHEEYEAIEFTVEMDCNDTLEITKTLESSCCESIIKVYPKDSETEESLNGASVTLRSGEQTIETLTVSDGKVIFDNVCKGSYEIAITKEGYTGMEFDFDIGCNKVKEFIKFLDPE